MKQHFSVAVVNVGDELLLGIRENSHLTYIAQHVSRKGGEIVDGRVVRDDVEEVAAAIAAAMESADIVFVTGGLGPTADDLTREAMARVLGSPLVHDAEVERAIQTRFQSLGRQMSENNLRQCLRPPEAEVIPNRWGTAPGLRIRREDSFVYLLPGPRSELRPMFEEVVLPEMEEKGCLSESASWLQLRTAGLGESGVESRLASIVERRPHVQFAYCAHAGIVDIRLSPADAETGTAAINQVGEECRLMLGENFFGFGEDSLAKILVLQLRCWDRSLAVAESCTGGLLASAFTDVPGASKVFTGGVVAYTNATKVQMLDVPEAILQQHGAVSAEAAVAMATGAAERLGADYALSVTGFAGPDGGTAENPVGTIYAAHFSPSGVWSKRLVLPGDRVAVKERAVNETLDWARRTLNRYKVHDFLVCPGGE
ncbi:MAG: competence/damage-inducible protein A [Puniceicoccaceae bacterium]